MDLISDSCGTEASAPATTSAENLPMAANAPGRTNRVLPGVPIFAAYQEVTPAPTHGHSAVGHASPDSVPPHHRGRQVNLLLEALRIEAVEHVGVRDLETPAGRVRSFHPIRAMRKDCDAVIEVAHHRPDLLLIGVWLHHAQEVADRAMQIFGGMGVCQDTMIPDVFTIGRFCRIADGPDEVHMSQLGKLTARDLAS